MGGILSGPEICRLVERRRRFDAGDEVDGVPGIEIEPFDPSRCGPNSYDVLLSNQLRVYAIPSVLRQYPVWVFDAGQGEALNHIGLDGVDVYRPPPTVAITIPPEGMWLHPGILYLGATVERTLCHGLVPWLDGRSSIGRAGLSVHVTAGRGDDGWDGRWTLEITAVAHPVKVYPNMRGGQVTFFTLVGERKAYEGKYQHQDGPTESRLHLDAEAKEHE